MRSGDPQHAEPELCPKCVSKSVEQSEEPHHNDPYELPKLFREYSTAVAAVNKVSHSLGGRTGLKGLKSTHCSLVAQIWTSTERCTNNTE